MNYIIITKQLAEQLPTDHELKKEAVCDPQSYKTMVSIFKKMVKPQR